MYPCIHLSIYRHRLVRYYAIVEMGLKPPSRLLLVVGKVEVGTAFILDHIDFGGYGYTALGIGLRSHLRQVLWVLLEPRMTRG